MAFIFNKKISFEHNYQIPPVSMMIIGIIEAKDR